MQYNKAFKEASLCLLQHTNDRKKHLITTKNKKILHSVQNMTIYYKPFSVYCKNVTKVRRKMKIKLIT